MPPCAAKERVNMVYHYSPRGVCPRSLLVELDGDVIRSVQFEGGCNGNLTGISRLVAGMKAADVIEKFRGTACGYKSTSCPDQLALALQEALEQKGASMA
jgi:uncharacterized protein (TIGR03905 family)